MKQVNLAYHWPDMHTLWLPLLTGCCFLFQAANNLKHCGPVLNRKLSTLEFQPCTLEFLPCAPFLAVSYSRL